MLGIHRQIIPAAFASDVKNVRDPVGPVVTRRRLAAGTGTKSGQDKEGNQQVKDFRDFHNRILMFGNYIPARLEFNLWAMTILSCPTAGTRRKPHSNLAAIRAQPNNIPTWIQQRRSRVILPATTTPGFALRPGRRWPRSITAMRSDMATTRGPSRRRN